MRAGLLHKPKIRVINGPESRTPTTWPSVTSGPALSNQGQKQLKETASGLHQHGGKQSLQIISDLRFFKISFWNSVIWIDIFQLIDSGSSFWKRGPPPCSVPRLRCDRQLGGGGLPTWPHCLQADPSGLSSPWRLPSPSTQAGTGQYRCLGRAVPRPAPLSLRGPGTVAPSPPLT